jgi:NAD(P)-dependent dehydrogenase (short-subunit alcohol dehydrogenase family)
MTARHTAIVTGANHGIGAATARALARRGCAVLCPLAATKKTLRPSQKVTGFAGRPVATLPRCPERRFWILENGQRR